MSELGSAAAGGDHVDLESGIRDDEKLELRLWLRLLTCSTMIERTVRRRLRARFDITLPRFDLLAQLDRAGGGLTMSALSTRMMVSNGNITGLTDRLVEEGLVRRETSETDRRSQTVALTPAGKRSFDAMTPSHGDWIHEAMSGLDRDDMQTLLSLLGKLKHSLKED
ncbi:MarR family winged helix-turn-helix transcriptional regulator [Oceanibacterium hippocampi]|uniref:Transcriptional activatory protein BadR n=1 Tax=Oceanibacterium hippocampi TaxID=745714 RepID=A0A1Y5U562_9PROT|nr:MarR family transcriptional regulator [Oceanibacterium hippocampi]SLN77436.1 Transcriptional activatory protein BadR [Oceanibacterium hippocampi]